MKLLLNKFSTARCGLYSWVYIFRSTTSLTFLSNNKFFQLSTFIHIPSKVTDHLKSRNQSPKVRVEILVDVAVVLEVALEVVVDEVECPAAGVTKEEVTAVEEEVTVVDMVATPMAVALDLVHMEEAVDMIQDMHMVSLTLLHNDGFTVFVLAQPFYSLDFSVAILRPMSCLYKVRKLGV